MLRPLTFGKSETTDSYAKLLNDLDVKLPIRLHDEDAGVVIDADGKDVFLVPVQDSGSQENSTLVASWIVTAVNTCAGFRATNT